MRVIYFYRRDNGDIKIGSAVNLSTRRWQLFSKYGELTLLGLIEGWEPEEEALHVQFNKHRVSIDGINGTDWFHPAPELLAFIDEYTTLDLDEPARSEWIPKYHVAEKTISVGVTIPVSMKEALERQREQLGIPQSVILREALMEWLEKHGEFLDTDIAYMSVQTRSKYK